MCDWNYLLPSDNWTSVYSLEVLTISSDIEATVAGQGPRVQDKNYYF